MNHIEATPSSDYYIDLMLGRERARETDVVIIRDPYEQEVNVLAGLLNVPPNTLPSAVLNPEPCVYRYRNTGGAFNVSIVFYTKSDAERLLQTPRVAEELLAFLWRGEPPTSESVWPKSYDSLLVDIPYIEEASFDNLRDAMMWIGTREAYVEDYMFVNFIAIDGNFPALKSHITLVDVPPVDQTALSDVKRNDALAKCAEAMLVLNSTEVLLGGAVYTVEALTSHLKQTALLSLCVTNCEFGSGAHYRKRQRRYQPQSAGESASDAAAGAMSILSDDRRTIESGKRLGQVFIFDRADGEREPIHSRGFHDLLTRVNGTRNFTT